MGKAQGRGRAQTSGPPPPADKQRGRGCGGGRGLGAHPFGWASGSPPWQRLFLAHGRLLEGGQGRRGLCFWKGGACLLPVEGDAAHALGRAACVSGLRRVTCSVFLGMAFFWSGVYLSSEGGMCYGWVTRSWHLKRWQGRQG